MGAGEESREGAIFLGKFPVDEKAIHLLYESRNVNMSSAYACPSEHNLHY